MLNLNITYQVHAPVKNISFFFLNPKWVAMSFLSTSLQIPPPQSIKQYSTRSPLHTAYVPKRRSETSERC